MGRYTLSFMLESPVTETSVKRGSNRGQGPIYFLLLCRGSSPFTHCATSAGRSWIFDKSSNFWAASCKNESNLLLVWITVCMCSNRDFSAEQCYKNMGERHQLLFGLRLVSKEFQHPAIQTKIEQHCGGFFQRIKVRQPIGKQNSMQTVIRTSIRLDSFLYDTTLM